MIARLHADSETTGRLCLKGATAGGCAVARRYTICFFKSSCFPEQPSNCWIVVRTSIVRRGDFGADCSAEIEFGGTGWQQQQAAFLTGGSVADEVDAVGLMQAIDGWLANLSKNHPGGLTLLARAQDIFSASEKQQQESQHWSAFLQPQGQFWHGNATSESF